MCLLSNQMWCHTGSVGYKEELGQQWSFHLFLLISLCKIHCCICGYHSYRPVKGTQTVTGQECELKSSVSSQDKFRKILALSLFWGLCGLLRFSGLLESSCLSIRSSILCKKWRFCTTSLYKIYPHNTNTLTGKDLCSPNFIGLHKAIFNHAKGFLLK